MTLTCILSATYCKTQLPSIPNCMKCPGVTYNAVGNRTLAGGTTVQAQLNGSYTNYNLIKKYQCLCSNGTSWDTLRLRCYPNTLK